MRLRDRKESDSAELFAVGYVGYDLETSDTKGWQLNG